MFLKFIKALWPLSKKSTTNDPDNIIGFGVFFKKDIAHVELKIYNTDGAELSIAELLADLIGTSVGALLTAKLLENIQDGNEYAEIYETAISLARNEIQMLQEEPLVSPLEVFQRMELEEEAE